MRRLASPLRPLVAGAAARAWLVALLLLAGCEATLGEKTPPPQPAPPPVAAAPAPAAPPTAAPAPAPPAPVIVQGAPPPAAPTDQRIRVGLLLPLTGASAALGAEMLDAAALALFEVGDGRLELLPRDSGATADATAAAATAAIRDGARLLLGPVFAANVAGAAGVARPAGVNVIAFSTDRAVAGGGVYLIGYLPEQEVERIVGFARSAGLARFALLSPDNAYGRAVTAAYDGAVLRRQGERVGTGVYPLSGDARADRQRLSEVVRATVDYDRRRSQAVAMTAEAARQAGTAPPKAGNIAAVPDVPFDAMLLADGGARLRAAAPFLPFYDVDTRQRVRLLGTSQWESAQPQTEPALHGGWYAGPLPPVAGGFEARYRAAFGRAPGRLAALAYDAVAIAAVLAAKGADFSATALTAENGFSGASGIFRLRLDGVVERGLAVLEVAADGVRVIDPPPATFDALSN